MKISTNILKFSLIAVSFYGIIGLLWPTFYKFCFKNEIFSDQYRFGDLYKAANLADFKSKESDFFCLEMRNLNTSELQNYAITVIGDSFMDSVKFMNQQCWNGAKYQFIHWNEVQKTNIKPISTIKNILIIEIVERNLRNQSQYFTEIFEENNFNKGVENDNSSTWNQFWEINHTSKADILLEQQFFGYSFFQKLKQKKAYFNWKVFEQVDDFAQFTPDKKALVYYKEMDKNSNESCLNPISEKEFDQLENAFDHIKNEAKSKGFDQVIFSVIPNKSTVYIEKDRTNGLLQKLGDSRRISDNYLNIYSDFYQKGNIYYQLGDTHWSCAGRDLWLTKIKQKILNNSPQ